MLSGSAGWRPIGNEPHASSQSIRVRILLAAGRISTDFPRSPAPLWPPAPLWSVSFISLMMAVAGCRVPPRTPDASQLSETQTRATAAAAARRFVAEQAEQADAE